MTALAPIIRILLRYVTGFLVAWGILSVDEQATIISDPEITGYILAGLGAAATVVVEGWYVLARKYGWAK